MSPRASVSHKAVSDVDLLNRFVSDRDERAFEELVRRYSSLVLGTCRRILGTSADVEDAFQTTMLVFASKAKTLDAHRPLSCWLYRVATNVCFRFRSKQIRRSKLDEQLIYEGTETEAIDPCPAVNDLHALILEEVNRLPGKYRDAMVCCYIQGQEQEDASRQLSISYSALRARLSRGIKMLQNGLARRKITLTGAAVPQLLLISSQEALSQEQFGEILQAVPRLQEGALSLKGWVSDRVISAFHESLRMVALPKALARGSLVLASALVLGVVGLGFVTPWRDPSDGSISERTAVAMLVAQKDQIRGEREWLRSQIELAKSLLTREYEIASQRGFAEAQAKYLQSKPKPWIEPPQNLEEFIRAQIVMARKGYELKRRFEQIPDPQTPEYYEYLSFLENHALTVDRVRGVHPDRFLTQEGILDYESIPEGRRKGAYMKSRVYENLLSLTPDQTGQVERVLFQISEKRAAEGKRGDRWSREEWKPFSDCLTPNQRQRFREITEINIPD